MSLKDRILQEWSFPVVNEADRPNRAAQNMKEVFDSNSNEIRGSINGIISDIEAGDLENTFEEADARENIESGDTLAVILGKIKKWFNDLREAVTVIRTDEDPLKFLRGDGQYAIPQAGEAINGMPSNGRIKSVLFKRSSQDFDVAWGGPSDIGAAAQSFEAEATLLAANWSGNTYTLRLDGVTENNAIEMLPPESADITDEQLSALQEANIQDGGQSENELVFVARGKVPEIDLPVRFIIRGDLGDGTRGGYDGADILNENEIILQRHLPEGFPYDSTIWIRAEEQVSFVNGEAEVYGDPLDHRITIGGSYVVTWNGEEYDVECDASALGLSRLRVDSLFSIVAMPRQFVLEGGAQLVLQDEIGLGTATFSIKRPGGEITKIDEKYLPDDIGGGDQVLGEDGKIKPELLPENIGGGDEVLNENGVIKQEHLPELFPYYKSVGVPETEITLTDGTATLQDPLPIVVGNTYSVGWNGSWYDNLVATGNDEMGDGSGVISKTLRVDGVFRIYCYPDAFISMGAPGAEITAYDGSETVTLEIVGAEITKMGEGLLPDSVNNAVKTLDDMIDDEGNIRYEYLPNDIPYKGKGYVLEPTDFTFDVLEDDETIAYLPYRLQIERQKEYVLEWNGRKHTLTASLHDIPKPNATSDTVYGYGVEYIELYSGGYFSTYYGVYVYDEEVFEETGIGSCIISHRDNVTSAKVAVHGDIVKPIAEECLPDSAKVLNSDGIIKQEHLPSGYPYDNRVIDFVMEKETLLGLGDDGAFGSPTVVSMTVGETYIVSWNGTDYECAAQLHTEDDTQVGVIVGNLGAMTGGNDTGEPFLIIAVLPEFVEAMGGMGISAISFDGSTSVTVSIGQVGGTIDTIDPKFLPEGYPWERKEVVLLEEQTVAVDADSGIGVVEFANIPVAGETYEISMTIAGMRADPFNATAIETAEDGVAMAVGMDLKYGDNSIGSLIYVYPEYVETLGFSSAIMIAAGLSGAADITISVKKPYEVHTIDKKYLPEIDVNDLDFPLKSGGDNLYTSWARSDSIGYRAFAEGQTSAASGSYSHAEGSGTTASGLISHAEGTGTSAGGNYSHAEGGETSAGGNYSHAEGGGTSAGGSCSHAEGNGTSAGGDYSHAEGRRTKASSNEQHVQGRYNIEDANGAYAHIVGNGTTEARRSNAHTLDWDGNAWFAGTVEGTALILKSSTSGSTKRFKITVDDSGTLSATEISE